MTASKSERLLNLLILLLVSRNYATKDQIRNAVEDYQSSSTEAFDKMFERDKEDLRALGIPIEVGFVDAFFEDEHGYRIKRDAFELPDIDLAPDEAAVVGLAARVWQHAGLASATSDALIKLKAAGLPVDREALDLVQPRLMAEEPSFDRMWEATVSRRPVTFAHRRSGGGQATERHLQPWGVVSAQGRWYVVGHDTDRGEPRLFRLSRVTGDVSFSGPAGSYEVPADTDVRQLTRSLKPPEPSRTASLLVRKGAAHQLRRQAGAEESGAEESGALETGVSGPGDGPWDRIAVPFSDAERFVSEVLRHLDAVVVESPDDVRAAVVDRLTLVAGGPA